MVGKCGEQCPACSVITQRALGNKMYHHLPTHKESESENLRDKQGEAENCAVEHPKTKMD